MRLSLKRNHRRASADEDFAFGLFGLALIACTRLAEAAPISGSKAKAKRDTSPRFAAPLLLSLSTHSLCDPIKSRGEKPSHQNEGPR